VRVSNSVNVRILFLLAVVPRTPPPPLPPPPLHTPRMVDLISLDCSLASLFLNCCAGIASALCCNVM